MGASGSRSLYYFLLAFHVHATIHNALLALVVDSLATLFPATPGGAGTKQGLIVFLFRGEAISQVAAARLQRRHEHRRRRLQPGARRARDVPDGADGLVAAARAAEGAGREQA